MARRRNVCADCVPRGAGAGPGGLEEAGEHLYYVPISAKARVRVDVAAERFDFLFRNSHRRFSRTRGAIRGNLVRPGSHHARRMLVMCSPLSGFLALWSSHCRANNRPHGDEISRRSSFFRRALLPSLCRLLPAALSPTHAVCVRALRAGGVPTLPDMCRREVFHLRAGQPCHCTAACPQETLRVKLLSANNSRVFYTQARPARLTRPVCLSCLQAAFMVMGVCMIHEPG